MSAVSRETNLLLPCLCGYKPDCYWITYGPKPYFVWCPVCKKQTRTWTGNYFMSIVYIWNDETRLFTVEQLDRRDRLKYLIGRQAKRNQFR